MVEQVQHFHKGSKIWWDMLKATRKPAWVPKQRVSQAGEVVAIEGNSAVIVIWNESRKEESYMIPLDQIRHRDIA